MMDERENLLFFNSSPEKISKRSMALWKDPLAPPMMSSDSLTPGLQQKKDRATSGTTVVVDSSGTSPSPLKQTIEDSVTLMATSWLENRRFTKLLWILLLAGPLVVSYYTHSTVGVSLTLALLAGLCTHSIVPELGRLLLAADLSGKDLNKIGQPKLAESLGIAAGSIFLISMFLFIPVPFLNWMQMQDQFSISATAFETLGNYTAAMLSISAMLFLGFADDVMNLKWRHKILLPAMAALPLLMIYKLTSDRTEVVVPIPLRWILFNKAIFDIGFLYYIYMAMLSIFCTHSINILAGVNGVEVGQSVIIGSFIILNNLLIILSENNDARTKSLHYFSLFLMVPFVSVSGALLNHNWFPASVFVGDTFCYFAGMTFAVAGILGHFSKTLLLFFIPQVFNFLLSVPQLFGAVPCPRHRLPRLNRQSGKLEASTVVIVDHNKLSKLGKVSIKILSGLRVVKIVKAPNEGNPSMICTNFTLLSTLLNIFGPLREDHLAFTVMLLQGTCCTIGLLIRHFFSKFVF